MENNERVLNFSAGPSQMPLPVLEEAQKYLLNYPGAGGSVMEMSHRTPAFEEILHGAKDNMKKLLKMGDDYEILFIPGGATMQFSMIPMNLAARGETTAYINTGVFAGKSRDEAARWGNAVEVATSKPENFTYIPKIKAEDIPADAKYLHITGNNTIFGSTYNNLTKNIPAENGGVRAKSGNVIPLVADWSSAILGKEFDINDYSLVYAGAQKNMGPSGMAVVIIKRDLIPEEVDPVTPIMLRYKVHADNDSMYNTPPCWSIYMFGLMTKWALNQGGVAALEKINREKSSLLYDFIDNSKIYKNAIVPEDRSIMNVTFTLPTEEMTKEFINYCKANGIINIKGHRLAGGCRASLYNGMPYEGVVKLVNTMKEFEIKNV